MALSEEQLVVITGPEGKTTAVSCSNERQVEHVLSMQREPFTIITVYAERRGALEPLGRFGVGKDRKLVRASGLSRGEVVLRPTVKTNPGQAGGLRRRRGTNLKRRVGGLGRLEEGKKCGTREG